MEKYRYLIYAGMWAIILTLLYFSHKAYEPTETQNTGKDSPDNHD